MLPKVKKALTALVCSIGAACTPLPAKTPGNTAQTGAKERWAVYYAKELPAATFAEYDLVVFDRLYYPEDFKSLQPRTVVLAYISIGEVHGDTEEHALLDQQKALIGTRTKWNSYPVDITSFTWANMVTAQVQDAVRKGFDGVMFDTMDTALHLADMESPEKGEKAKEAAIALIGSIKTRYPNLKIMLNRGLDILPRVAPVIDYALGESLLAETDVSTGQSKVFPPSTYQSMASRLLQARTIAPHLKLYTLDYWNLDDVDGIQKLYAIHRAHGFNPYVTTPDLRKHTPEPPGTHLPRQKIV